MQSGRPGIPPRRSDSVLTPNELSRRNARRKRNREAAQRCRERRLERVGELETQVKSLQNEKLELERANLTYRAEIENLRFQLEARSRKMAQSAVDIIAKATTPITTLTPLQNGQVKFEFPEMSEDAKSKARQTSLTEFNNFLRKL